MRQKEEQGKTLRKAEVHKARLFGQGDSPRKCHLYPLEFSAKKRKKKKEEKGKEKRKRKTN